MDKLETAIAVFPDHDAAEEAIKTLAAAGFAVKNLSVVGNGYHSEEKVVGFYTTGDRIKFWGSRGAFWGGFWGLFLGGLFLATPLTGPVVVLGFLATIIASAIENAVVLGGVAALGAALYSLGVPKDSVLQYESAIKADNFLVMARGTTEEIARAKTILGATNPSRLDIHRDADAVAPAKSSAPAAA
ncbi:MAG: general stress protein [Roseiarcus sp.]